MLEKYVINEINLLFYNYRCLNLFMSTTFPNHVFIIFSYLAHGSQIALLAMDHRIGASTLYKIIPETCQGIYTALSSLYLNFPETPTWRDVSKGFSDRWQLPGCISAIDGKHFHVKAPDNLGSLFFNYKKYFSIVLMAAVNHNLEFMWVDCGAFGGESDGGVFARTQFGRDLETGNSNIPDEPIQLPGSNTSVPYYFVGNDAFKLRRDFMKPYKGNNLSESQKIFNYRLSRGRRCVESAFGILVMRWRLFEKAIGLQPCEIQKLVMAAICLHNFLSSLGDKDDKIEEYKKQRENCEDHANEEPEQQNLEVDLREGSAVRQLLTDYCIGPAGSVPWQWEHVRRGLNIAPDANV